MDDQAAYEYYLDPEHRVPAGPARRRERPRKTAMVAVRFDPAVIDAVKRLTEGSEVTVSSWIRQAVAAEVARKAVRPQGLIPGTGRTVSCPHMSVGNVVRASCGECGPLRETA